MRGKLRAILSLICGFLFFSLQAQAQINKQRSILVKWKNQANVSLVRSLIPSLSLLGSAQIGKNLEMIEVPSNIDMGKTLAQLNANKANVDWAEPNYVLTAIPNEGALAAPDTPPPIGSGQAYSGDPYYINQRGLTTIDVERAWNKTIGSASVRIAVIDSGIDTSHTDLFPDNVDLPSGFNYLNPAADPDDDEIDGHGTHVSGIIGAIGNNSIGIAGVNWRVQILPMKFIGHEGYGYLSDAVLAIQRAIQMGAQVINMSFGSTDYSFALRDAISEGIAANVLFVAAAGNNGSAAPYYPAAFSSELSNLISVAATHSQGSGSISDTLTNFSNYSQSTVHLAAPGYSIISTVPRYVALSGYAFLSGTSMAAPHVSGVAGLLIASGVATTIDDLKERLLWTTEVLTSLSGRVLTSGRLNADRALNALIPRPYRPTMGTSSRLDFSASVLSGSTNIQWSSTNTAVGNFTSINSNIFYSSTSTGRSTIQVRDAQGHSGDTVVTVTSVPLKTGFAEETNFSSAKILALPQETGFLAAPKFYLPNLPFQYGNPPAFRFGKAFEYNSFSSILITPFPDYLVADTSTYSVEPFALSLGSGKVAKIEIPYNNELLTKLGITSRTDLRIFGFNPQTSVWEELVTATDSFDQKAYANVTYLTLFKLGKVQVRFIPSPGGGGGGGGCGTMGNPEDPWFNGPGNYALLLALSLLLWGSFRRAKKTVA